MQPLFISWQPLVEWLVLVVWMVGGLIGLGWLWWQKAAGWLWRLGAFVTLTLVLTGPQLGHEQREPLPDVVVVVQDDSPSQHIGDRHRQTTDAAQRLTEQLDTFENVEVRHLSLDNDASRTDLFGPLRQLLIDVPPSRRAAVIVITDGQVHDRPSQGDQFGPVHVLLTGSSREFDRRLTIVEAPSYGIVGQEATIRVRVVDDPGSPDRRSAVINHAELTPSSRSVEVGEVITLTFPLEHGGTNTLTLDVAAVPGELTTHNNRAFVSVNAVRNDLRVLLLSGQPHAGERVWRSFLKSDPNVDLTHLTILREAHQHFGIPNNELSLIPFPVDELFNRRLHTFDLIILDAFEYQGLVPAYYLENIARYVRGGGALFEAGRNPPNDTLFHAYDRTFAGILPAGQTGRLLRAGFRPTPTDLGRRHVVLSPLLINDANPPDNWGRWFQQSELQLLTGDLLMSGIRGHPLLVLDRVEEGRVAQLASGHFWLWQRGFEGGGPATELLRRLVHWLMQEPELEENGLHARFDGNQLVIERRFTEQFPQTVTVSTPTGTELQVSLTEQSPGLATALYQVTTPGLYRITDESNVALAGLTTANQPEFTEIVATDRHLTPISEASRGGTFWLESLPNDASPNLRRASSQTQPLSGRDWIAIPRSDQTIVTGSVERPLLPDVALLTLALVMLALAWLRESRAGRSII